MVKRFITTLTSVCLAFGLYAESKYLTVELKDGSAISFLLTEQPVITFENSCLVINKDAKTTYSFENLRNFRFTEEGLTDLEKVSAETLRFVQTDEETIEVQNAPSGSVIILTAVNGAVLSQVNAGTEGKATVKMPSQAGVYVLSVGNQSFKIIHK